VLTAVSGQYGREVRGRIWHPRLGDLGPTGGRTAAVRFAAQFNALRTSRL
jgi:hypothetical protein